MRRIAYSRSALRTLRHLPGSEARLILAKIEQYASAPQELANNVLKLQGRPGYRLRVGDWRVIFEQTEAHVDVLDIRRRGKDTYD